MAVFIRNAPNQYETKTHICRPEASKAKMEWSKVSGRCQQGACNKQAIDDRKEGDLFPTKPSGCARGVNDPLASNNYPKDITSFTDARRNC